MYNGRTNPVEHVSPFNQRMTVHSRNEALMCKVFPSSLGLVAMRWFYGLEEGLINSFQELTRAFGARFVTCSRVPHPLDSLLSITMQECETLKIYSNRYWEMFNEIDKNFEDIAIRTFKVSLPTKHDLRKSLTRKPAQSMRQLMDQIDEYKWVEEDQKKGKGKAKLVKVGKLKQFLYQPIRQGSQVGLAHPRDTSSRPSLGTISVILAAPSQTSSYSSRVMSIARPHAKDLIPDSKFGRMEVRPALSFSDKDKVGTFQLVLVDQGSGAEVMYPDLYKELRLKPKDLVSYDSPLVGFDGKTVIPKSQIRLPVQVELEVVEVDFIVVDAYSPYAAIMARPWLHAIGVVSSNFHLKMKYPLGDQVEELIGSQDMARQCLVAAIRHQSESESSATIERDL
ncbi:uncharacterized protein LOC142608699 [Castanea sativa]|uniref:uncharacterized protein LOC142608699 n=1 Tax=Castanea sativa TaxID=21020 RepID=UPI003F64F4C2